MKPSMQWLPILLAGIVPLQAAAFELELPIAAGDVGYSAFGVAPFGYHVAEHRYDGHPGLDFEYLPGAKARAGHAGKTRWTTDMHNPALKTLTIEFSEGGKNYQLFYTNMASIEPGAEEGTTVAAGQIVGTPGVVSGTIGSRPVSYAMIHFQFADMSQDYGLTNATARSPEPLFSAAAQSLLRQIWSKAAYHQMICEPFLSNPRGLYAYPVITRTWRKASGTHAERVDFQCDYAYAAPQGTISQGYRYTLYDAGGGAIEAGAAYVAAQADGVSTVDLTAIGGGVRQGLIEVKDKAMRLDYSAAGGARPASLGSSASSYTTGDGAASCATGADAVCFSGVASPYPAEAAIDVEVVIDWSKLGQGTAAGDLWLQLQTPDGASLYANDRGNWTAAPGAFLSGVTNATSNVRIPTPGSVVIAAGKYELSAVLRQGASALSNLASAQLYVASYAIDPAAASSPVYRFFNEMAGGHFFTMNESEKSTVLASYPWLRFEGTGFKAWSTHVPGTLPVYRFFNHASGGHFFTISESEKAAVLANLPWFGYEGIGFYAFPSPASGTSAVYRFFNDKSGGHFFTISEAEKAAVIASYDWFRFEGIGFHARPAP